MSKFPFGLKAAFAMVVTSLLVGTCLSILLIAISVNGLGLGGNRYVFSIAVGIAVWVNLALLAWIDYLEEVLVWWKNNQGVSELKQAIANEQVSDVLNKAITSGNDWRTALRMAKALLETFKILAKEK